MAEPLKPLPPRDYRSVLPPVKTLSLRQQLAARFIEAQLKSGEWKSVANVRSFAFQLADAILGGEHASGEREP